MKKAKFIRKFYGRGYDRDTVYLEYEYKGYTYYVTENLTRGNESLASQHKTEQYFIDLKVGQQEAAKKQEPVKYEDTADYAFDLCLKYMNGEISEDELKGGLK